MATGPQTRRDLILRAHLVLFAFLACAACRDVGTGRPHTSAGGAGAASPSFASPDSIRCDALAESGGCDIYGVSLIDLIARPADFHGKRVRITGYVHFEFEGNGVYLNRDDWAHSLYRNGLWLEPPTATPAVNDEYALIEGEFDARIGGHMGLWSGMIHRVTRLEPWGRGPSKPPERFDTLPARR